jgi:hypothetical protein
MDMATQYFVTRRGANWFVDVDQQTHGPYYSRRDALADALDAAELKHARDKVLIKEPGKDAALVWKEGNGPRPDLVEPGVLVAAGA